MIASGERQVAEQRRLRVDELGRLAADERVGAERRRCRHVADGLGEGLAVVGQRLDVGHDRQVGGVGPAEPARRASGRPSPGPAAAPGSHGKPPTAPVEPQKMPISPSTRVTPGDRGEGAGVGVHVGGPCRRRSATPVTTTDTAPASSEENSSRITSCTLAGRLAVGRAPGRRGSRAPCRATGLPSTSSSTTSTPVATGTGRRMTRVGDAVPEALVGRRRRALPDRQRVDAAAEGGEHRRQHDDGVEAGEERRRPDRRRRSCAGRRC